MIGPQGSGKGTQASILLERHRFISIAGGDIARKLAKKHKEIREEIKAGQLLSDQILDKSVVEIIQKHPKANLLFDGYPRNIEQARFIIQHLKDYHRLVLYLELSDSLSIKRLTNRLICSHCQTTVYGEEVKNLSLLAKITYRFGRCPYDGYPLIKRTDDTAEAIQTRLNLYHQETEPLINYLKQSSELVMIDASPTISQIAEQIEIAINQNNPRTNTNGK